MGIIVLVVNILVLPFLVLKALGGPLFDAQIILSHQNYPKFLAHISSWYVHTVGDYMVIDQPNFLVGLAWFELFVSSPLSVINIYGLIFGPSWFKTTCFAHGLILTTSMVAIIGELRGSGKSPRKLLNTYYFFMGLSILVIVRGLLSYSSFDASFIGNEPTLAHLKKTS